MVPDTGKEEPASAGCLGSSASQASYSLRRVLNVHQSVQDPQLSSSRPAGGPILGNLLSGRGLSTNPHQPGEKCATAGDGQGMRMAEKGTVTSRAGREDGTHAGFCGGAGLCTGGTEGVPGYAAVCANLRCSGQVSGAGAQG